MGFTHVNLAFEHWFPYPDPSAPGGHFILGGEGFCDIDSCTVPIYTSQLDAHIYTLLGLFCKALA